MVGWYNEKKTPAQYAEEKRWVFSFDLKDESEDSLTERGREFQIPGLTVERIILTCSAYN